MIRALAGGQDRYLESKILKQPPIGRLQIGHKGDQNSLKAHHQQYGGQDEGLYVTAAIASQKVPQEAQPDQQTCGKEDEANNGEEAEGPVDHKDTDDGDDAAADIGGDAPHQTGGAQVRIDPHWHRGDRHVLLTGLDDGLLGIGVVVEDHDALRGAAADRPKAAGSVGDIGAAGQSYDPTADPLQELFGWGEVPDCRDWACADDNLRAAIEDGPGQGRDVAGIVLIVRVRIHDDVRPSFQAGVQAGHEGPRQA